MLCVDLDLTFPGVPANYKDVASIDPEYAKNLQVQNTALKIFNIDYSKHFEFYLWVEWLKLKV